MRDRSKAGKRLGLSMMPRLPKHLRVLGLVLEEVVALAV
jgi:hypothetical protein